MLDVLKAVYQLLSWGFRVDVQFHSLHEEHDSAGKGGGYGGGAEGGQGGVRSHPGHLPGGCWLERVIFIF